MEGQRLHLAPRCLLLGLGLTGFSPLTTRASLGLSDSFLSLAAGPPGGGSLGRSSLSCGAQPLHAVLPGSPRGQRPQGMLRYWPRTGRARGPARLSLWPLPGDRAPLQEEPKPARGLQAPSPGFSVPEPPDGGHCHPHSGQCVLVTVTQTRTACHLGGVCRSAGAGLSELSVACPSELPTGGLPAASPCWGPKHPLQVPPGI